MMGALGVGDESRVVLYDAMGSSWAARVWWMLRWIGFDRAAILDGGLQDWTAENLPLSVEAAQPTPRTLTVSLRPDLIAGRDEVLAAIDDDSRSRTRPASFSSDASISVIAASRLTGMTTILV